MNRFDPRFIMLSALNTLTAIMPTPAHQYVHDSPYTRKEAADKKRRYEGESVKLAARLKRINKGAARAYCYTRCINRNPCLRG